MDAVDDDEQQWLAQLSDADGRRARQMLRALHAMGCKDAKGWAGSEITENFPQVARFRFLHQLWPQFIDTWREGVNTVPAAQRAIDAGADPDDLARFARSVAYETVFGLLYHLDDDGLKRTLDEDVPYWVLAELDSAGVLTGRLVGSSVRRHSDPRSIGTRRPGSLGNRQGGAVAGPHNARIFGRVLLRGVIGWLLHIVHGSRRRGMRATFIAIEEGFSVDSKDVTFAPQHIEPRDPGSRRRR